MLDVTWFDFFAWLCALSDENQYYIWRKCYLEKVKPKDWSDAEERSLFQCWCRGIEEKLDIWTAHPIGKMNLLIAGNSIRLARKCMAIKKAEPLEELSGLIAAARVGLVGEID
jgi:hypothetical protein